MPGDDSVTYKMDTILFNIRLFRTGQKHYNKHKGGITMLRMEIALFLVLSFVAYMYFEADKEQTPLHRTFALLLITVLLHLLLECLLL